MAGPVWAGPSWNDDHLNAIGAPTETEATGDGTLIAILKRVRTLLNGGFPATALVAGGGTEAAALRVTVASDSTGVLSVDDNGGSLTTDHGKTIKSVTGTVSVDTDIVTAVASKRIKVIAFSLISASTTANTITFQSNASTALWTTVLQALTGTVMGSNLATSAPSFLFATAAGEKLTLDVSAAQNVTYNVTYFDDDAS